MPTIESLAEARVQDIYQPNYARLTRSELELEIEKLRQREALLYATEQIASIGHYEWNYEFDRLESCSEEYAHIFNMTIAEVRASQDTWEKTLSQIHPDDVNKYKTASNEMRSAKTLDVEFRLLLENEEIKHIREIGIVVTDKDGVERGTFGILQDVTQQAKHKRDLEYRDELARQAESVTDIGHFIYDEENEKYTYMSEGCARIYGATPEDYVARMNSVEDDLSDIVDEDRERVAQEYRHYRESGQDCAIEYRVRRTDGAIRWVRELGKAKLIKNGVVTQTLGVVQDITEQVKREQELVFKDALANQAEAITDIGHFVYDEINQKYIFVSPGLLRIHGRDELDSVEDHVNWERDLSMIHPEDRDQVKRVYDHFLVSGGAWQVDYRLIRADGETRWIREMGKTHTMNHGIPEQIIGVLQDITEQKLVEQEIIKNKDTLEQQVVERTRELANTVKQLQQEVVERKKIAAELDFLANHDALTGLPSLRLCKDRLDHSLAEARRNRQMSAVMFLDLDGFKEINDSHGHELGDQVLKVIADRIRDEIRETDTVARIGGDEFVIILSSLPEIEIVNRVAASLIKRIISNIQIGDIEVQVSASVGISLYPEDGTTAEELIREADKAMYAVKHQGKNNFGFSKSSHL